MLARERRRLRVAFGAALVAAATAPRVLVACAGDDAAAPALDASATDGTLGDGAVATEGGAAGDDAGSNDDASGCRTEVWVHEGGPADAGADVDADLLCGVHLSCGLPHAYAAEGCNVVQVVDGVPVSGSEFGCWFADDAGCAADVWQPEAAPAGGVTLTCFCDVFSAGGRRPRGARKQRVARFAAAPGFAAFVAASAAEEARSVRAFEELGGDLARLGAPEELVRAAARAARDERRHARVIASLDTATIGGDDAGGPRPRARPRRAVADATLEAVARHNAVAGCVRETFAALVATWQAKRAEDPRVRRVMERVARDETRHAALAWAVADWAARRLDPRAADGVARARRRAFAALRRELRAPADPAVAARAGLPSPAESAALLATLESELAACAA